RVAKLSVGSVLQPGDNFIELAMLRSAVEAEIGINPVEIGFVRPGDRAIVKLDPYNYVEHGWAEGKVRWISEGTYTTPPMTRAAGRRPRGRVAQGGNSPRSPRGAEDPGRDSRAGTAGGGGSRHPLLQGADQHHQGQIQGRAEGCPALPRCAFDRRYPRRNAVD